MLASREDQRFRYERSLSHEIELTLSNAPGVLESRVHLNLPAIDPIFGQPLGKKEGSGSVLLVVRDAVLKREEVATLVAGASGVPEESISVLITSAEAIRNCETVVIPEARLTPVATLEAKKQEPSAQTGVLEARAQFWDLMKSRCNWHVMVVLASLTFGGICLMVLVVLRKRRKRTSNLTMFEEKDNVYQEYSWS